MYQRNLPFTIARAYCFHTGSLQKIVLWKTTEKDSQDIDGLENVLN